MNNNLLILLCISGGILIFSIISISVAPIMNNTLEKFNNWGKYDCQILSDEAEYAANLDERYTKEIERDLCYRRNGMSGLEYISFIMNIIICFVIAQMTLIHNLDSALNFQKYTGLISLIGGIAAFIFTIIYVGISGYIFVYDPAFYNILNDKSQDMVKKLYSNGALKKNQGSGLYIYSNDKSDFAEYATYSELGKSQYNYNKELYKTYDENDVCSISKYSPSSSCEYFYEQPTDLIENKYLYDRWLTALVLAVFIFLGDLGMAVFGFMLYKGKEEQHIE